MRTLVLLASLLLFVLHAQAQSLEERADHVPAQDRPGAEVQDMTISFAGDEPSSPYAAELQGTPTCHCRPFTCYSGESPSGHCEGKGFQRRRCCRR
uniref:Mammalian defensins domain-containing protein n=1 Tax=Equus asinus TaxID=9793 RepID=A0A9L0ICL2_EQUAS|nr:alpha-defensin 1-like [Equus asinus]